MPRTTREQKEITLNLRLDTSLKSEFMAATVAESRPAAEVLRRLIREYVGQARRQAFLAEAERQSRLVSSMPAARLEEAEVTKWVENVSAALPEEPEGEWFRIPDNPRDKR
jgi:hypothetical protein